MSDRLTVLDCSRKAILALPNAAFKLWMCYWMNEDDEQESFVSQPEIRIQTTMGITSIVHWTQWLVRHGWLVPTGKTAYDIGVIVLLDEAADTLEPLATTVASDV